VAISTDFVCLSGDRQLMGMRLMSWPCSMLTLLERNELYGHRIDRLAAYSFQNSYPLLLSISLCPSREMMAKIQFLFLKRQFSVYQSTMSVSMYHPAVISMTFQRLHAAPCHRIYLLHMRVDQTFRNGLRRLLLFIDFHY